MKVIIDGIDWTPETPQELYKQAEQAIDKYNDGNYGSLLSVLREVLNTNYDDVIENPLANELRDKHNMDNNNVFIALTMSVILETLQKKK